VILFIAIMMRLFDLWPHPYEAPAIQDARDGCANRAWLATAAPNTDIGGHHQELMGENFESAADKDDQYARLLGTSDPEKDEVCNALGVPIRHPDPRDPTLPSWEDFNGWTYLGYTCSDGWHSPSIGKRGACSHHGGVSDTPILLSPSGTRYRCRLGFTSDRTECAPA
jgi:hypothetical protein